jgi:hypothetical protein
VVNVQNHGYVQEGLLSLNLAATKTAKLNWRYSNMCLSIKAWRRVIIVGRLKAEISARQNHCDNAIFTATQRASFCC